MSCGGQTDEEIMKNQIGYVDINDSALHSLGGNFLSLPVQGIPKESTNAVLAYAEVLTE
jgi:hypothetical protein